MIYSVKLSNFKQHKSYEANFEAGLNTITGENGFGKTTVLKAIMFSLFGVAAAGAKNHLTTWGETGMQVETTVLLPVGRVVITRGLTKAEVRLDDELLASGQTAVTGFVEDQLGMTAKLFKNLLYAEQGETQLLLKMGAAGLQKQLEIIANIDVIDKVITQIGTDNSKAEGEVQGIGAVGDINSLRDQLDTAEVDLADFGRYYFEELEGVETVKRLFQERKDLYDAATLETLTQGKLLVELAAQQARADLLSEQLSQLQEPVEVSKQALEALVTEVSQKEAKLTVDTQVFNTFLSEQVRYQYLTDRVNQFAKSRPILAQALALETLRVSAFEANLDAKADMLNKQASLHDVNCRACNRPLEGKDRGLAQSCLDLAIEAYDKKQGHYDRTASDLGTYLTTESVTLQMLQTTAADLAAAERELVGLPEPVAPAVNEAWIIASQAELNTLKADSAALQVQAFAHIAWMGRKQELSAQLNATLTASTPITEKVALFSNHSPESLEAMKADQDSAYIALQAKTAELKLLDEKLRSIKQMQTYLLSSVKLAEIRADKVQILQHQSALRSDLQKYLRTNRAKFLEDSWVSLTHYASHLIAATTEGLMTTLSRSDSGDFTIIENGQLVPIEELSGARKSIVGLCLRLSLAHLFYGSGGFVLLDEVTADCSEGNAARIAGMLRGLPSQVIMVTHRQGDAVNANHSILID